MINIKKFSINSSFFTCLLIKLHFLFNNVTFMFYFTICAHINLTLHAILLCSIFISSLCRFCTYLTSFFIIVKWECRFYSSWFNSFILAIWDIFAFYLLICIWSSFYLYYSYFIISYFLFDRYNTWSIKSSVMNYIK